MANPDMSGALMGDEMMGAEAPDMFGSEPMGDGLELGAGDETELDEMFAADAQSIFPDFDDDQLLALQKLIDSRAKGMELAEEAGEDEGL